MRSNFLLYESRFECCSPHSVHSAQRGALELPPCTTHVTARSRSYACAAVASIPDDDRLIPEVCGTKVGSASWSASLEQRAWLWPTEEANEPRAAATFAQLAALFAPMALGVSIAPRSARRGPFFVRRGPVAGAADLWGVAACAFCGRCAVTGRRVRARRPSASVTVLRTIIVDV